MTFAALITAVLVLVIVGVLLYILEESLPMAPPIKTAVRLLIVVAVVLYLLNLFGLYHWNGVNPLK